MRSFKILIVVSAFFSMYVTFSFAQVFKPDSEPDGFRGIKWGTDILNLSGMQYSHTAKYGGVKYYLREGDELVIGRANLNKIEYRFWNGKLYSVEIFTKGFTNFEGLKEAVFEKFGASFKVTLNTTEGYTWDGKQTDMVLDYDSSSEKGSLFIYSKTLSQQVIAEAEAEKKQKAKEGTTKGF